MLKLAFRYYLVCLNYLYWDCCRCDVLVSSHLPSSDLSPKIFTRRCGYPTDWLKLLTSRRCWARPWRYHRWVVPSSTTGHLILYRHWLVMLEVCFDFLNRYCFSYILAWCVVTIDLCRLCIRVTCILCCRL